MIAMTKLFAWLAFQVPALAHQRDLNREADRELGWILAGLRVDDFDDPVAHEPHDRAAVSRQRCRVVEEIEK